MVLRAAILDYPLKTIEFMDSSRKMLGDVMTQKQIGFFQTSQSYVVMDKHDMIGTHFILYDATNVYDPKIVLAIRNTYENRVRAHGLSLPIEDYIHLGGDPAVEALNRFRLKNGPLVDCNAWFVDTNWSKKNSGLNLSEIGFLLVTTFIHRLGFNHVVGTTNEKYKASRWIRMIGEFQEGLGYNHPTIGDPHCIALVDPMNREWMANSLRKYKDIVFQAHEILGEPDRVLPLSQIFEETKRFASVAA